MPPEKFLEGNSPFLSFSQDAELQGVTEIYLAWFNGCIVDDNVTHPEDLLMS
jgi:hypothetical protein